MRDPILPNRNRIRGNCPRLGADCPRSRLNCPGISPNCPGSRDGCPETRPDCPKVDPRARAHRTVVPEAVPVVPRLGAVVPGLVPIAPACVRIVRGHGAIVPNIVPVVPRPAVLSRHPRFLSLVRFRLSESRSQLSHVAGQCAGNSSQCLRTCCRQVFSPKHGLESDACLSLFGARPYASMLTLAGQPIHETGNFPLCSQTIAMMSVISFIPPSSSVTLSTIEYVPAIV